MPDLTRPMPDSKNFDTTTGIAESASYPDSYVMHKNKLDYAKANAGFWHFSTWVSWSKVTQVVPLERGYYRIEFN